VRLSLKELLDVGGVAAPPALVGEAARARLAAVPSVVPPVLCEGAYECRLEAEADRVDFEASISALTGGREALADAWDEFTRQPHVQGTAAWQGVRAFLEKWIEGGSHLHSGVQMVWLEFDAPEAGAGVPEPFLVFTLDSSPFYPNGLAEKPKLHRCVMEGLDRLSGGLAPGIAACVRDHIERLPRYAELRHLALRPGDGKSGVRLIARFPWERLPEHLESEYWPGSTETLKALLEKLCADTLVNAFNLDLSEAMGPRVGVEFHFSSTAAGLAKWGRLFDQLEAAGACTREKREALGQWISEPELVLDALPALRLVRDLLVKVVYEEGQPLRAKAYLSFAPRPARP